jgi:hypothetical protein
MRQISILLGAGFSVLDKYPTRWGVNKRLSKIDATEIMVHTGGTALFLNGQKDVNAHWMGLDERNFIQQFLEFYNSEILGDDEFDYEEFFDFYHGLLKGKTKSEKFETFAEEFRSKQTIPTDNMNLISRFHKSFNQLLGSLLTKWPEQVHLAKPYTKYGEFLTMIELLKSQYETIHIHTLNHDLLLEELSHSDAMVGDFCDGYELYGTPFFGMFKEIYPVRLKQFTNNFDKKIRLYKLHGSIDSYIYNFQNKEYISIRKLPGVEINSLKKEYYDENGNLKVDNCWWNYYPDFLSGTTEKIERYKDIHYYAEIFKHFEANLKNSDRLITIGYGLGDSKINEFIEENLLSSKEKKALIIDPKKNDSKIYDFETVEYYGDGLGVSDIDLKRIEEFIK